MTQGLDQYRKNQAAAFFQDNCLMQSEDTTHEDEIKYQIACGTLEDININILY